MTQVERNFANQIRKLLTSDQDKRLTQVAIQLRSLEMFYMTSVVEDL
jgi:hypothetical protein